MKRILDPRYKIPKPGKVKTGEEYMKMLKMCSERVSKWPYWMIGEESMRFRKEDEDEEKPTEPLR